MGKRHELRRRLADLEGAVLTGERLAASEVREGLAPYLRLDEELAERGARLAAVAAGGDPSAYVEAYGACGIRRHRSSGGTDVFLLPIETFPGHVNNLYLVRDGRTSILVDAGSPAPSTAEDLDRAWRVLERAFGVPSPRESIRDLLVTHAHLDHYGDVADWAGRARVHAHEVDAPWVVRHAERVVLHARQIDLLLRRAGVEEPQRVEASQLMLQTRRLVRGAPVTDLLVDGRQVGPLTVHEAPGHCPGQVCLQVDDLLLSADHVLARITPHQAPALLAPGLGLATYVSSLRATARLSGVRLALPGHEEPITDLRVRIGEILASHEERLLLVREACRDGLTIAQLAERMFGRRRGFDALLAVEETAAHVEWLHGRGRLEVCNADDLAAGKEQPLTFRATDDERPIRLPPLEDPAVAG